MKIAIIGAGVSGLAAAQMLQKSHEVDVFERRDFVGGIAKTREIDGGTYHITGGHCFNSKHQDVLDFVFSMYPMEKWNKIERRAKIYFHGRFVSYPIEFALKEIYRTEPDFVYQVMEDLFGPDAKQPENLKEWFIYKFGRTLAEEYFIPYNAKIWGQDPGKMSYDWVYDKLPVPNKKEIFRSLLEDAQDSMPHAHFYYPKTNNQADFIAALAQGLRIKLSTEIESIEKKGETWLINETMQYDRVISTVPLNVVPNLLKSVPANVLEAAQRLAYNKVTTMMWKALPSENTWTYLPSKDTICHRHIHIGNFFRPQTGHIITEAIGDVSEAAMLQDGSKFPHLIEPLSYHVSDHAYVVYDENYADAKSAIVDHLQSIGLHTLGRFGEWEYYNMDLCIKSAMNLVEAEFS